MSVLGFTIYVGKDKKWTKPSQSFHSPKAKVKLNNLKNLYLSMENKLTEQLNCWTRVLKNHKIFG